MPTGSEHVTFSISFAVVWYITVIGCKFTFNCHINVKIAVRNKVASLFLYTYFLYTYFTFPLHDLLGLVIIMKISIQSCIHDPLTTTSNEEIFLQDFQLILKWTSELIENLEEMFLGRTTCYYMHSEVFGRVESSIS